MAFNIADLIEHAVDAVPDRTAIVVGDRRVTYRELEERANRLAHHLAGQGVGAGDHVAVYSYNSPEFVETMFAAFKLRAVPINVNYRYVEEELAYLFDNADITAAVLQRQFCPRVAAIAGRCPLLRHLIVIEDGSDAACELDAAGYEEALAAASPHRDFGERSDDDLYILYTGGTTGFPKGVVWRHEDVFRTLGGGIDFMTREPVPDDRTLAERARAAPAPGVSLPVAPLMHGAGQWGTFNALFQGNTVVYVPRFDPDEVWRAVERNQVNTVAITGDAMARPMIEAMQQRSYDTSSVLAISSTAAVFSPSVKEQFLELLPNIVLTDAVGSTESGFNGMRMVDQGAAAASGVVNVAMGPDTIVLDDDNRPVEPGSGVVGRMARGGNVPLGYYKDPERTAATFIEVDGKRYSVPGDHARVEDDGTMTLLGRGSQCINTGGEKVYPEEVEAALKAHPLVFDALVVGVPDERWGHRVAAVVQPRPGATVTLEELDAHCRGRIAGYKVPRELHLVEQIHRQPSGKPDYPWARSVAEKPRAEA
jgi:3-oxocholest-4-en-26-oate---CoA ligase